MRLASLLAAILYTAHSLASHAIDPSQSLNSSTITLSSRDLPVGACNANTPCVNGACCGKNGECGYSPASCAAGCTSNCNAKAQCGQYAAEGSQKCPLNVCCSEFG